MSAVLSINEAKGQSIDLGNPFRLLSTFAAMGRIAGPRFHEFDDLFGVPEATEIGTDVDPEWLDSVRKQAAAFRDSFGDQLTPEITSVLDSLTGSSPT